MACLAGGGAGRGLGFVFSSRREFSRHKCRYVCGLHPDITSVQRKNNNRRKSSHNSAAYGLERRSRKSE